MESSIPSDKIKAYFSRYLLHEEYGFYHHLFEDEQLPSEFKKIEELALQTPELNNSKRIREAVKELKVPPFDQALEGMTYNQCIKLYTLVSFLTNSYLFNEEPSVDVLPEPLSTILYSVAKKIGNRPIMTYACCAFWNTQVIDKTAPVSLDNLKLRVTFTGNPGEEWFYLVSIANDIIGLKVIKNLILAQEELDNGNPEKAAEIILKSIPEFGNSILYENFSNFYFIDVMIKSLKRMHERLDPEWFYSELRRYLIGYQKFPNGLRFSGVPEYDKEGPKFSGMSAGQSPFYQTFQNALGNFSSPVTSFLTNCFRLEIW